MLKVNNKHSKTRRETSPSLTIKTTSLVLVLGLFSGNFE